MIYFLMDEDERLIEIGLTRRMNSRLARRRRTRGNALRLLAVIDGDLVKVSEIRERFSGLKVDRDWYRIDTAIVEFIGRKGHPWSKGMPTGTPAYYARLVDLAAVSRIPGATLAEIALSDWADRNGFSESPTSREILAMNCQASFIRSRRDKSS